MPSSVPQFTPAEHDSEADPPPVEVPTVSGSLVPTGVLSLGNPDAPDVLLVFTNHVCRYCREFNGHHLPRLLDAFVRDGSLRVDIAMRPLRKYPESTIGALALICAGRQNNGAHINDVLSEMSPITRPTVLAMAKSEGLDQKVFTECLDGTDAAETLARLESLSDSFDARLVPTFFINGERIVGLPEYAELEATIKAARAR